MTSIDQFVTTLRELDISLQIDQEGRIDVKSPKGALTQGVREQIRERKEELLKYLRNLNEPAIIGAGIQQAPHMDAYPLSFSQMRLWIASRLESDSTVYNIPVSMELNSRIDPSRYERAIATVINRHEILRTVFREEPDGTVHQLVLQPEALQFRLPYLDLRGEADRYERAGMLIRNDRQTPFNLKEAPLFRLMLLRLEDDKYLFFYNMHHIISDGWSMRLLRKEILTCYNSYLHEEEIRLPELKIQYKDYAVWQKQQLQAAGSNLHRDYWMEQLAGELPVLSLPSARVRPPVLTHNGHALMLKISKEISDKLRNVCHEHRATLFMGALAVLKALFYRYTGEEDIIVGTSIDGRRHPDLENQIGVYLNMLALRTRFRGTDTFSTLLRNVREVTLSAYEHQVYPFDKLAEELQLKRDRSRSAIFDVYVNFLEKEEEQPVDHISRQSMANAGADEITEIGECTTKFDLILDFREMNDGLYIHTEFNTDVYPAPAIYRLLSHYKRMLEILTADPGLPVAGAAYLSTAEAGCLLNDFNNTGSRSLPDSTVVHLFTAQAERTPDSIALLFGKDECTYSSLDKRSNQLAHFLSAHGVTEGTLVPVCIDRSIEMIVGVLGILKAGAAYVPIDPEYPLERINYMLSDIRPSLILTTAKYGQLFNSNEAFHTVYLDEAEALTGEYADTPCELSLQPQHLAYVIYTSGSTGKPKGVQIEHGSLYNYLRWVADRYITDNEGGNAGLYSSLCFDLTVTSLFGTLIKGRKLVIFPQEQGTAEILAAYFDKSSGLDVIKLTPAHIQLLEQLHIPETGIRKAIVGGEQLLKKHIELLLRICPGIEIYNEYGPTEATVGCIVSKITALPETVHIGRPVPNTSIYILDTNRQLVPAGVAGEIYIEGVQLAREYMHRPELTAERFISNPFAAGSRLYRTGDLARWMEDGNIEYLGRTDDQVKIRGYRIEPAEVTQALLELPGLNDATVVAHIDADGQCRLAAYIVSTQSQEVLSIRQQLAEKLPDYMIPGYFIQVDQIPLTAHGKVDRKALPLPEAVEDSKGPEYVAPRNAIEAMLVEIWQDIFRKSPMSVKQNFYSAGGDSIKAILMASQLMQQGYTIKVGDILKHPVLEELAQKVTEAKAEQGEEAVEGEVVLTPVQQRFFESSYQHKHHYNQSVLLYSSEVIDESLLERSLAGLVKHHDALRMVYRQEYGEWRQYNRSVSQSGDSYLLEVHDLHSSAEGMVAMGRLCDGLQQHANLSAGPLLRAGLFHMADGDRLLVVVHHLVVDGVSWRILLEDLSNLYRQYQQGTTPVLPVKSTSFREWAKRQYAYANSDELAGELVYWQSVLSSAQPLAAGTGERPGSGAGLLQEEWVLDSTYTGYLLRDINHVYNTDINDVLLSILSLAFTKVMGVAQVLVEMEGHGRQELWDDVEVGRTVGWFTSLYPVLLEGGSGADLSGHLVSVKEHLRKIPNKGIGYGMLRYLREGGKALAGTCPEAMVTFNYLGDFGSGVSPSEGSGLFSYGGGYRGEEIDPSYYTDSGLTMTGLVSSGNLKLTLSYASGSYEPSVVQRLGDVYISRLRELIDELRNEVCRYITPSDLTYKDLSRSELLELEKEGEIADVCGLSPLQEGIYYHWLSNPSSQAYVEQMSYRFKGTVELPLLKAGFNRLVDRHGILRTTFHHEYGRVPIQVQRKATVADFRYVVLPGPDHERALEELREADRREGFDLGHGSQMRLTVASLGSSGEYEFIWSNHHIVMDGWCRSILIREFYSIYQSLLKGAAPVLGPVPGYVNYIRWLGHVRVPASMSYWKGYLSGYEDACGVPFRQVLSAGSDYRLSEAVLDLPEAEVSQLRHLCRELEITESSFIQGCWGYLLSRYNNRSDVVFGTVVSGRPADLEGVEEMIGLFSNTIPVRVQYNGDTTVQSFLKRMQSEAIAGLPHHYIQLSLIQGQTAAGSSLFDHILVYENYPVEELLRGVAAVQEGTDDSLGDLRLQGTRVREQTSYDFNVMVIPEAAGGLSIQFRYNGEIYGSASVQRIGDHLRQVIKGFMCPGILLRDVRYLTDAEQALQLELAEGATVPFSEDRSLVSLFRAQVRERGDEIALVHQDRSYSYHELDELSGRLSSYLRLRYGIVAGAHVGVCLKRSEWLIISLLGVLKSGASYVPVDPSYPAWRKEYQLSDSGCTICLDEAELSVFLSEQHSYAADEGLDKVSGEGLVYVMYTSGSTGHPKGCMVGHEGLINRMEWMWHQYGFDHDDVVLQKTTFVFDVSVWEIFMPLCWGCKMVLCGEEDIYSPERLSDLISRYGVSSMHFVPGMLDGFIDGLESGLVHPSSLVSLKRVFCSGEALLPSTVNGWYGQMAVPLHNLYGPTEASIEVSYFETMPGQDVIPIGRPIWNTRLYVLDRYLQLLPAGLPGEIYIGGIGLAQGYWDRQELTAERFIANPFRSGELLYRTGDVGWWQPDGELVYGGRTDEQVKIRGYRIELGEITDALQRISGIEQAVTVSVKQGGAWPYLVSYYVSGEPLNLEQIREHLQQRLPEYMIPTHIIPLPEFPLTPTGKVDRKALPSPETLDVESSVAYIPPRNAIEECLVLLYQELFQKENIGVKENFFSLGGNSIKAIMLAGRLKQQHYTVKILDILKYPVIEDLAVQVTEGEEETALPVMEEDTAAPADSHMLPGFRTIYDLSYNQQFYYTHKRFTQSSGSFQFYLPAFEKARFLHAYERLLTDLPVLRVRFLMVDGRHSQEVLPIDRIPDAVRFIERTKENKKYDDITIMVDEMTGTPFDLYNGEVLRCNVLHEGADAYVFITASHMITDHYSNMLLKDMFIAYYNENDLQLPALSYLDFIAIQQHYLRSAEGRIKLAFWEERLEGILKRHASGAGPSLSAERTEVVVNRHAIFGDDYNNVLQYCKQEGVFLSGFMLSAFCLFIYSEYPEADEFLMNVVVNGRDMTIPGFSMEGVVGQFSNSLPLVFARQPSGTGMGEIIKYVQEVYMEGRMNQQVPEELIRQQFLSKYGIQLQEHVKYGINYIDFSDHNFYKDYESLSIKDASPEVELLDNDTAIMYVNCYEYKDCINFEWVIRCDAEIADSRIQHEYYLERIKAIIAGMTEITGNRHTASKVTGK